MYARHLKLKESRTNAKGLEQEYTNLVERLAQEQQKNSRIEQDVKNFEERENYLTKIKTLNMKRAWVVGFHGNPCCSPTFSKEQYPMN